MVDTLLQASVASEQQTDTTASFPTTEMRQAIADEIFADTLRELEYLGFTEEEIAQVRPLTADAEVVDQLLMSLGITEPGQTITVNNSVLTEAMRVVHSDTRRALASIGEDPRQFHEPQVYCHEDQQLQTLRSVIASTGCNTVRSYTYT